MPTPARPQPAPLHVSREGASPPAPSWQLPVRGACQGGCLPRAPQCPQALCSWGERPWAAPPAEGPLRLRPSSFLSRWQRKGLLLATLSGSPPASRGRQGVRPRPQPLGLRSLGEEPARCARTPATVPAPASEGGSPGPRCARMSFLGVQGKAVGKDPHRASSAPSAVLRKPTLGLSGTRLIRGPSLGLPHSAWVPAPTPARRPTLGSLAAPACPIKSLGGRRGLRAPRWCQGPVRPESQLLRAQSWSASSQTSSANALLSLLTWTLSHL